MSSEETRGMNSPSLDCGRRGFLRGSLLGGVALGLTAPAILKAQDQNERKLKNDAPDSAKERELVKAFVGASHGQLTQVVEMLAAHPALANAAWAWRGDDWETGLGAASHMGRADIATVLIDQGARPDIFWAAMAGETDVVRALIGSNAGIIKHRGPHGISLQFHAALSGEVDVADFLLASGAELDESTLRAAVQQGHYDMTAWLLARGMRDVNQKDFSDNTLLQIATSRSDGAIADLLRQHGAR